MKHLTVIAAALAACLASACQGQADATAAGQGARADAPSSAASDVPVAASAPIVPPALLPAEASAAPTDGSIVLNKGMTADIAAGTSLTFEKIISDSRCPAGVQCVWAGEVTVGLALSTPAGAEKFELSERAGKRTVKGYDIALVSYGPCPGGPAVTPLPGECASMTVAVAAR